MKRVKQKINEITEILNHPRNRSARFKTFIKYLKWNLGRRLLDEADYAINITSAAQIILSNRENYSTLAYTCGLYDFEDMQFLSHYLRQGDVFGDFGSNVGVYSVLAGSLGAVVLAVEPVPETYARLKKNLHLNSVKGEAVRCGLSDSHGIVRFTSDKGGLNHVALHCNEGAIEVDVLTADEVVTRTGLAPKIIKIDVEGYELPLLRGCSQILTGVEAIIIELNGSGKRYGFSDRDVYDLLINSGFGCFDYHSESRELLELSDYQQLRINSLFINLDKFDAVCSRIGTPNKANLEDALHSAVLP